MKRKKNTRLVHEGINRSLFSETSEPIFMTSGFVYKNAKEAEDAFQDKKKRFIYSRYGNPTVNVFEERLASIEGAEKCWATSSGMSALFTILMSYLKKGDRVVAARALFGSCHYILTNILPNFGIEVVLIDGQDLNLWEKALKKKTKLVFFETPSNPCLEIIDIKKVSEMSHRSGALVVVDNVFATPILQKPIELGADVVMYSATKHIDGHGRVVGGAILSNDKFCEKYIKPFIRNTGPSLSPFNAWVLLKGLETLDLRMSYQVNSTKEIINYLTEQEFVSNIFYPFNKKNKSYNLAKSQMLAGGNILSFTINCKSSLHKKKAFDLLDNLKLIKISNNLGDNKSLITHPYTTTHHRLNEKEKRSLRITKNLIRLSVGLEDTSDLIKDIDNSFNRVFRGKK